MYSGDSRVVSMAAPDEGQAPQEVHPALEVIELANGETVWYVFSEVFPSLTELVFRNVINGLREADEGSVYSRGSFVSEYSTPEDATRRGQSPRRSVSPLFSSNKKLQQLQGKSRPETKVC